MHHIVGDAWSMDVLVSEVSELYEALRLGQAPALPELPIQYADYALWQREWLQGEALDAQFGYWQRRLGKEPPALELPTIRPRLSVQSYRGAAHRFTLSKELSESVQELSRLEGSTLFMTLLAAFQTLLCHYTGQEDVSVGTPIAGRRQSEVEHLIGCFVNTLVLRSDLSGDPTFREVLRRVREVCLGAYDHQDLPFDYLVEKLRPHCVLPVLFPLSGCLPAAPRDAGPHGNADADVQRGYAVRVATRFNRAAG